MEEAQEKTGLLYFVVLSFSCGITSMTLSLDAALCP